jgi:DNA polymerase-4
MILHVDGDGFFAYCEMAAYPALRGMPVVVGAERGIVTASSYPAKRMGVTRGLPIFKLRKEFPSVTVLPSHFELYEAYSAKLYGVLTRYCEKVERYSIDECFAVLEDNGEDWEVRLRAIKTEVQENLGITFSFGLAETKSLAKLASKWQKPDGATVILAGQEKIYLEGTPIGKVWGIGRRTAQACIERGIRTALDLRSLTLFDVTHYFSLPIIEIWHELGGVSVHEVGSNNASRKSLQATRTFPKLRAEESRLFAELSYNIEIVTARAREEGLFARAGNIFLKTNDFHYYAREFVLPEYSADPKELLTVIEPIFKELYKSDLYYRATGITLSGLREEDEIARDLFGTREAKLKSDASFLTALDSVHQRFGTHALFLGSSLGAVARREDTVSVVDSYISGLPYPYLGEVV